MYRIMMLANVFLIFSFSLSSHLEGETHYVPDDYSTIQGAIHAAQNGDRVVVRPGTYPENLDFAGKAVAVVSEKGPRATVIDGGRTDCTVLFWSGEGRDSVIEGFTLTNGEMGGLGWWGGGGIMCEASSPTIRNNIITKNYAFDGGGIFCYRNSSPLIAGNVIADNELILTYLLESGGGIFCSQSSPTIVNNLISCNIAQCGGGMYIIQSDLDMANNIVAGNSSDSGGGITFNDCDFRMTNHVIFGNESDLGGGIFCYGGSEGVIVNSILWNNDAPFGFGPEIYVGQSMVPSTLSISFYDLRGGPANVNGDPDCTVNWGTGMITDDPLFEDPENNDFHLTFDSPCRDAGYSSAIPPDLKADFEGDPRVVLERVDMGADEFYPHLYHLGDATPGGTISIKIVGYPSTPVRLAWGQAVLDQPFPTQHGELFTWPFVWSGHIGDIPTSGVLTFPVTLSVNWSPGDRAPMQALVGSWGAPGTRLTNLMPLVVE